MGLTRYLLTVCCTGALALGATACGSDDKTATTGTTATTGSTAAPEDQFASDPVVAAGLQALVGVAEGISNIPDETASKKASDGLEPVWMKVEGTVKKNEPDMYATIEEDLSLLESGDQAKTKAGAKELSQTVDAYLAKHPG